MAASKKGVALARPDAASYVTSRSAFDELLVSHILGTCLRIRSGRSRSIEFGASYEDFSQMSDAELIDLLERARSFLTRRRRRG